MPFEVNDRVRIIGGVLRGNSGVVTLIDARPPNIRVKLDNGQLWWVPEDVLAKA